MSRLILILVGIGVLIGLLLIAMRTFGLDRYLRLMMTDITRLDQQISAPNSTPIFISLTTTPKRIPKIFETLKSLLDQSVKVDKIYVCIPYTFKRTGEPYQVPELLLNLKSVEIVRCEDFGPGTKLLPILNIVSPDDKIIYLDDDNIYPYTLVETLVKKSDQYPNSALCVAGLKVNFDTFETFKTVSKKDDFVDIVQGYGGVLVKPRFFSEKVYELNLAPKEARLSDDFWFSCNLDVCGVKRIKLGFDVKTLPFGTLNFFVGGLSRVPGGSDNDRKVLEYFYGERD